MNKAHVLSQRGNRAQVLHIRINCYSNLGESVLNASAPRAHLEDTVLVKSSHRSMQMCVRWTFTDWKRLRLWGVRTYPTTELRTYSSAGNKALLKPQKWTSKHMDFLRPFWISLIHWFWLFASLTETLLFWPKSLTVSCSSSAHRIVLAQPLSGSHLVQSIWWHQWHFTAWKAFTPLVPSQLCATGAYNPLSCSPP